MSEKSDATATLLTGLPVVGQAYWCVCKRCDEGDWCAGNEYCKLVVIAVDEHAVGARWPDGTLASYRHEDWRGYERELVDSAAQTKAP